MKPFEVETAPFSFGAGAGVWGIWTQLHTEAARQVEQEGGIVAYTYTDLGYPKEAYALTVGNRYVKVQLRYDVEKAAIKTLGFK